MDEHGSQVSLPLYSLYLIGFTMFFMLIAIVVLAVALYLVLKKKSICGLNFNNKQYIRQESTGVTPLYNANYDEPNKNNGSTLTVNSGIIEISEPRVSDPITPTRLEDTKIIFTKKPMKSIVPVMQRGQMDAICKEVLRKVKKSDSASFRDLNELLKGKTEDKFETNCEAVTESAKEKNNEEKLQLMTESVQSELNKNPEIKTETQNEIKTEIKNDTNEEIKNGTINEAENKLNFDASQDVKIEVNDTECDINADDSESETEYDTVPSPIRYRHSGPESDIYEIDDMPLYDLPPRRSHDGPPRSVIQIEQESNYLMPISKEKTESCYINAKRNSFHLS